jgi:tetratricopeptide (TPR) repeat protein
VGSFTWNDDFSAARNEALRACTGDWILILDADERLAPDCGTAIRSAIADAATDMIFLPLYNASSLDAGPDEVLSGTARLGQPALKARLYKRIPGMRWEGAVHEELIRPGVCSNPRKIHVDAPIIHLGYVDEIMQSRGKYQRNLMLIEKRCRQQPNHPWVWGLLVRVQMNLKDFANAARSAETAWRLVETVRGAADSQLSDAPFIDLAWRRATLLHMRGDLIDALDCLDKAISWGWFHPNLGILRAQVLYGLAIQMDAASGGVDHLAEAHADLVKCLDFGSRVTVVQVLNGNSSWNALAWKGVIELLQGKPDVALSDFRAALRGNPQYKMAEIGCSEALIDMGSAGEALEILEPILPMMIPDAWTLAAAAYEIAGNYNRMNQCLETVKAAGEAAFWLRHRISRREQLRHSCLPFPPAPGSPRNNAH